MGAPTDEETPHPWPRVQGHTRHGGDQLSKDAPGDRRRLRGAPESGGPVDEAGQIDNAWSSPATRLGD